MSLLHPDNRKFMQGASAYDPPAQIARVKVPVLIVQGAYDGQINLDADAKVLAAAQPAAKLVILPTTNHVLKAAPSAALATQVPLYMDPRTPIVPDVANTISAWIKGLR